jgi:hypothetical protein
MVGAGREAQAAAENIAMAAAAITRLDRLFISRDNTYSSLAGGRRWPHVATSMGRVDSL